PRGRDRSSHQSGRKFAPTTAQGGAPRPRHRSTRAAPVVAAPRWLGRHTPAGFSVGAGFLFCADFLAPRGGGTGMLLFCLPRCCCYDRRLREPRESSPVSNAPDVFPLLRRQQHCDGLHIWESRCVLHNENADRGVSPQRTLLGGGRRPGHGKGSSPHEHARLRYEDWSYCRLFVLVRFSDDWWLLLLVILFIFVFVIIVIGITRRHRVAHEHDEI